MPKLVFFDLDGTVARRDTLWQWVRSFLWRHPWRWLRLPAVLPCLVRFLMQHADHGELKASLLRTTLGGVPRTVLRRHTARWVQDFPTYGCFFDAMAAIRAHQSQQDILVLMSASVDVYVPELAQALGFQECICTPTAFRPDDRYDGSLTGPNCRGAEKFRQFQLRHARDPDLDTWAYANAGSDLPHLQLADRGFLINGRESERIAARAAGIECLDWS